MWTSRGRETLGKMSMCTASLAYEVERHMQSHQRQTDSSSVGILESSRLINISQEHDLCFSDHLEINTQQESLEMQAKDTCITTIS